LAAAGKLTVTDIIFMSATGVSSVMLHDRLK
jgi:hypothetical protein